MRRVHPRGFLLDEAIFQSFGIDILELSHAQARSLLHRRAIILVDVRNREVVVERCMKRHSARLSRGEFKHPMALETVVSNTSSQLGLYRRVLDLTVRLGCPYLHIYADDGFEKNLSDVKSFEVKMRERFCNGAVPP